MKIGKKTGIFCVTGMLAMAVSFNVWEQEQIDVETLERQNQNMEKEPVLQKNGFISWQNI